jgi:hypothetical protein
MQQAKTLDNQIMGYLSQLSDKKKRAVLTVVKTFAEDSDSLCNHMPAEVKKGVARGLSETKKGMGRPHSEVMKKYDKWLKE